VPAGWSAVSSSSHCPYLDHAGAVVAHQCADLAIIFHVCGLSVTSKTGEVRGSTPKHLNATVMCWLRARLQRSTFDPIKCVSPRKQAGRTAQAADQRLLPRVLSTLRWLKR
jgi:hypothetical protein